MPRSAPPTARALLALALTATAACATPPRPGLRAAVDPDRDAPPILIVGAQLRAHPGADAVLVEHGRIAAIGSSAPLRARLGDDAVTLDARGAHVLPGFVDAHVHVLSGGLSLEEVDVSEVTTLEGVLDAIDRFARAHPDAPWIRGRGFQYGLWPAGALPTAAALDHVVPDRPVYLESYDGHSGWASSRALALAGVDAATPDPADGHIARAADGKTPAGALLEGAMALVERVIPEPSPERKRRALLAALEHLVALGVTSVQDITRDPSTLELYGALEAEGRLPVRVRVALPLDGDLDTWAKLRARWRSPYLEVGGLKGFVDGVVESKTAFMLAPYEGAPGERGRPLIAPERLDALVLAARRAGFQVMLHAIGDAAVRLSLDAFAHAAVGDAPTRSSTTAPDCIEHIEVLDPADAPRFAALGIIASMQPYHAVPSGDDADEGPWSEHLGAARRAHSFPWRELRDAGATLAFGSDWPVMSADPLAGLAVALTRKNADGRPGQGWNAHQRLDLAAALEAYGPGARRALGRADGGGLEVGAPADLVILDPSVHLDDPQTLWAQAGRARVRTVLVGGRVRWAD